MARSNGSVAFFDIGNTLASVTFAPEGHEIEQFSVYPYVHAVLSELRDSGVRMGIISNPGAIPPEDIKQALKNTNLWEFFDPTLVVFGLKDSPRIFEEAADKASASGRLMFVGEDPTERTLAIQAGFLVAPHPLLALSVLDGASLRYVRIGVPPGQEDSGWQVTLRDLPLLPVHVTGKGGTTLYAVATSSAVVRLDDLGFRVDRLGAVDEPLTTNLYLLRDDRQTASDFLTAAGNSTAFFATAAHAKTLLASTAEGLLVAVPQDASVENYHFSATQHGHNLKLIPSPVVSGIIPAVEWEGVTEAPAGLFTDSEKKILGSIIQAHHLESHIERYSGMQTVGAGGAVIRSRHVRHADNSAAVTALVRDLEKIGRGQLVIRRHRFTHEGRSLENVEAELLGTGLDGVVLVTAHMDSTAARDPRYQADTDPAPGADDDATGIAGVLAAAEALMALDAVHQRPRRSVRFVLFNAEEHGLVGSESYARDQRLLGAPIVAVLQMDMIGYDRHSDPTFELHAGISAFPAVEAQSLTLTQVIAQLVPFVSGDLPAPQIYPLKGGHDPAEGRSDHYSFQSQGYAACLVSEDFFIGPDSSTPLKDPNPHYHLPTDKKAEINLVYAANIARVIAAAAWAIATR